MGRGPALSARHGGERPWQARPGRPSGGSLQPARERGKDKWPSTLGGVVRKARRNHLVILELGHLATGGCVW